MNGSLVARNVTVRYGAHTAVDDVDVELHAGELHALLGPNGAGKSSLVRALALVGPSGDGRISVNGVDLRGLAPRDRAARVAFLPQDTALDLAFGVAELVRLGRYAHLGRWHPYRAHDEQIVSASLERVGVAELSERVVTELSGGQRQLVMLAKTLAQQAAFVLLDEPVSALDLYHQLRVLDLLRELADSGIGVGVVLHDLNLAARYADRLTVMSGGSVAASGVPEQVLTPELVRGVYRVDADVARDHVTSAVRVTAIHPLAAVPAPLTQEVSCTTFV